LESEAYYLESRLLIDGSQILRFCNGFLQKSLAKPKVQQVTQGFLSAKDDNQREFLGFITLGFLSIFLSNTHKWMEPNISILLQNSGYYHIKS